MVKTKTKVITAVAIVLVACACVLAYLFIPKGDSQADQANLGLVVAEDGRYYYDENGVQQYGFQTINGSLYYFDTISGRAIMGWFTDADGSIYYFGPDCKAVTGEQTIDGTVYFFDKDGRLTDAATTEEFTWKVVEGKHYCLDASGGYVKGLAAVNGSLYYFDEDGVRQTGWHEIDGKRYYFNLVTGRAAIGWMNDGEDTYYFSDDGYALVGQHTINGEKYTFDEQGRLQKAAGTPAAQPPATPAAPAQTTPAPATPPAAPPAAETPIVVGTWKDTSAGRVYEYSGGTVAKGSVNIDGNWMLFNDSGVLQTGWVEYGGRLFRMDETTGIAKTGWQEKDGNAYYTGADGAALANLQLFSDGSRYYFDPVTFVQRDGLQLVDGKLYYFAGEKNAAVTGWYTVDTAEPARMRLFSAASAVINRYYFCAEHYALTGLQQISGYLYAFNDESKQVRGWYEDGDTLYCFEGTNGSALTNAWANHSEGAVRFGAEGKPLTGLFELGGRTYYSSSRGIRQSGWVTTEKGKYHFADPDDNAALCSQWADSLDGRVYLGENGAAYTGVKQVLDVWYGFGTDGVLLSDWQEIGGELYRFDADGKMLTGWQPRGDNHYYLGEAGSALKGLQTIAGDGIYYFNKTTGLREGGLKTINASVYLFEGENQKAIIGHHERDNQTYLFGADGAALTGVKTLDGAYYFYDKNGVRTTGWQTDGTYRYYFDVISEKAVTGWFTDAKTSGIYYFDTTTARALAGTHLIGGKSYTFDTNGRLTAGDADEGSWVDIDGTNYYVDADGNYVTGLQSIGGAYYYYFNDNGAQKTGWVTGTGYRYYFDPANEGKARIGWFVDAENGGKKYYFGPDGNAYVGVQEVDDEGWFAFGTDGVMQTGEVVYKGARYYFDLANGGKAAEGWYPKDRTGAAVRYYDLEYAWAVTGLQSIGGEEYLFDDNGVQLGGEYVDTHGRRYLFAGAYNCAVKGLYSPDEGVTNYYYNSEGYALVGLVKLAEDGPYYYFNEKGVMQTGWVQLGNHRYYFQADGSAAQKLFTDTATGYQYYFGADGYALTGGTFEIPEDGRTYVCDIDGRVQSMEATTGYAWVEEDGKWYYKNSANEHFEDLTWLDDGYLYFFGEGGLAETGWKIVDGNRYLFGDDFKAVIGWHRIQNGDVLDAYYFCADGYALTREQWLGVEPDLIRYVFNDEGVLTEGTVPVYNTWEQIGDDWYYYDSTGRYATGLRVVEGHIYLFDADGVRLYGRQTDGLHYYYLDPANGQAQGGWIPIDGRWYLFDGSSCKQQLGWQYRKDEDGNTYTHYYDVETGLSPTGFGMVNDIYRYFHADGHMAVDWETIEGERYYFFQNGALATGVVPIEGTLYAFAADGRQTGGWNSDKDGKRYYFKEDGAVTGWEPIDGRWYHFDETTAVQLTDWQLRTVDADTTHTYYYFSDGTLPKAGWRLLNNMERYIFEDGHMAIGFEVVEDSLYYFNKNGLKSTGATTVDGVTYPFDADGKLALGWYETEVGAPRYYFAAQGALRGWNQMEDGIWYRFDDATGVQKLRWQERTVDESTTRHYFDEAGVSPAAAWTDFDGVHRYFHADGSMAEGWTTLGEGEGAELYYFIPGTGRMATGAMIIDKVQYSFGADGKFVLGWNTDEDGNRYYFTEEGALTGWSKMNEQWYCFDAVTGVQQLDWQQRTSGGKTLWYYYFGSGNLPEAGWNSTIDGEERYVLADGQMAQGWMTVGDKNRHFDEKGLPAAGWMIIDGRWFCFDKAGDQLTGWQPRPVDGGGTAQHYFFEDGTVPAAGFTTAIDGKRRYVAANGELPSGWLTIGGDEYYFNEGGIPRTGQHVIDGKTYGFDSQGRYMLPPTITNVTATTGWAPTKTVTVTASANSKAVDKTLQYSFNNGATWQSSNVYTIAAGTTIAANHIQIRDVAGNIVKYPTAIKIDGGRSSMHGIDVSSWQGWIDWNQVAADGKVDFVVARSLTWDRNAYNPKKGTWTGYYAIDPYFERNIREAKARGIKVGTYLYSYAFSTEEMLEEISFFMNSAEVKRLLADGIYFDLPVYIDFEDKLIINNTHGKEHRTQILQHGMVLIDQMSNYKFTSGFYMNYTWSTTYVDGAALQNANYEFWYAYWDALGHSWKPEPPMWQYGTTYVSGISGGVDANYLYKDYSKQILTGNTPAPTYEAYKLTVTDQNTGQVVTGAAADILAQIVMAEVGGFNNAEVFKAQAVAAHSWILYQQNVAKVSAPRVVLKTPTSSVISAVNEVAGQYLLYGGQPALATYFAYSGGVTNDAKYWNSSNNLPYLQPVSIPYDASKGAYTYSLTQEQMRQKINAAYGAGTAEAYAPENWIRITSVNSAGYVTGVEVCGHKPTVDTFYQSIMGTKVIMSPNFTFTYSGGQFTFVSKGSGHGIGMSQNGAYGLAISNYNYKQILGYFYPGTTIGKM